MLGLIPTETVSTRGDIASEGAALKVVIMEAPTSIPTVLKSPRPKPTHVKETQKPKKDKRKRLVPVHPGNILSFISRRRTSSLRRWNKRWLRLMRWKMDAGDEV